VPTDPIRRQAARTATLVAIPVAAALVAVSVWTYGRTSEAAAPAPEATSPVTLSSPPLAPDAVGPCRTVIANLPDAIQDHKRRPIKGDVESSAAYGDPPITLSCGVAVSLLDPTTVVYPLGGVCWAAFGGSGNTIWRTVDRKVGLEVVVPGPADGSGQSVVPLGNAITTAVPRVADPPTGCG
jgi:hypothetical protein